MNKDQMFLENAYDEILEEGWKSKAAAIGVGALGLGAMLPSSKNNDNAENQEAMEQSYGSSDLGFSTSSVNMLFKNNENLKSVIKGYLKSTGKSFQDVQINGDYIIVKFSDGNKKLLKPQLQQDVLLTKTLGKRSNLSEYIYKHLQ